MPSCWPCLFSAKLIDLLKGRVPQLGEACSFQRNDFAFMKEMLRFYEEDLRKETDLSLSGVIADA